MAAFSKLKDQLSSTISGRISPQAAVAAVASGVFIWRLYKVRAYTTKKKRYVVIIACLVKVHDMVLMLMHSQN